MSGRTRRLLIGGVIIGGARLPDLDGDRAGLGLLLHAERTAGAGGGTGEPADPAWGGGGRGLAGPQARDIEIRISTQYYMGGDNASVVCERRPDPGLPFGKIG